jgi:hypothetical protein
MAWRAQAATTHGPPDHTRRETEVITSVAERLGGRVTCLGLYPWPLGGWPISPELRSKIDRGEIVT